MNLPQTNSHTFVEPKEFFLDDDILTFSSLGNSYIPKYIIKIIIFVSKHITIIKKKPLQIESILPHHQRNPRRSGLNPGVGNGNKKKIQADKVKWNPQSA